MQNYLSHFAVHMRISFLYGFAVVRQLVCVTVSSICEPNCSAVFWSSATLKSKYLSFFWFHLALQGVAWELFHYWGNFKVNLILLKRLILQKADQNWKNTFWVYILFDVKTEFMSQNLVLLK